MLHQLSHRDFVFDETNQHFRLRYSTLTNKSNYQLTLNKIHSIHHDVHVVNRKMSSLPCLLLETMDKSNYHLD